MKYIIIDFEYNQAFDFIKNDKAPSISEIPFEIIQIGAVKLNEDYKIIEEFNYLIKPQVYKRIHPFVGKITKIKNGDLKDKLNFSEVYSEFLNFINEKEFALCFWGSNDLKELFKNTTYYNLDYSKLPKKYINIQSLTSKYLKLSDGRNIGLKNAIELFELPIKKEFHNALNDARYTADIFEEIKKSKIKYETINFMEKKEEKNKYGFNTEALYKTAEDSFGRKLSRKEKNIIRKVYVMGRQKRFDLKN